MDLYKRKKTGRSKHTESKNKAGKALFTRVTFTNYVANGILLRAEVSSPLGLEV
jgi:hypothetical protein